MPQLCDPAGCPCPDSVPQHPAIGAKTWPRPAWAERNRFYALSPLPCGASNVWRRQSFAHQFMGRLENSPPSLCTGPFLGIGGKSCCKPATDRLLNLLHASTDHEYDGNDLHGAVIAWIRSGRAGGCSAHRVFSNYGLPSCQSWRKMLAGELVTNAVDRQCQAQRPGSRLPGLMGTRSQTLPKWQPLGQPGANYHSILAASPSFPAGG
jgi:hypothetical protein